MNFYVLGFILFLGFIFLGGGIVSVSNFVLDKHQYTCTKEVIENHNVVCLVYEKTGK